MSFVILTSPSLRYNGPEFEEFCIDKGAYLPASRDRTPCISCPLGNLCQAGFEEQVRRVLAGENPSLTENRIFTNEQLSKEHLLHGLNDEQIRFLQKSIPSLE